MRWKKKRLRPDSSISFQCTNTSIYIFDSVSQIFNLSQNFSQWKITCIFDIYFEIYFTNCTRKSFLNSASFIKNNQFYSKRPDRQVSELAGCPENGYNRGTGGENFACPCQHALTQYSRASFQRKEFRHDCQTKPWLLHKSIKYDLDASCLFIWLGSGKPTQSIQSA